MPLRLLYAQIIIYFDFVMKGDTGPQGERGERGDTGPQGERGDIGPLGNTGREGIKGEKGLPGNPGPRVSIQYSTLGTDFKFQYPVHTSICTFLYIFFV